MQQSFQYTLIQNGRLDVLSIVCYNLSTVKLFQVDIGLVLCPVSIERGMQGARPLDWVSGRCPDFSLPRRGGGIPSHKGGQSSSGLLSFI